MASNRLAFRQIDAHPRGSNLELTGLGEPISFAVFDGVHEPDDWSANLIPAILSQPAASNETYLEIGVGCGIILLAIALRTQASDPAFVGCDINPLAVDNTRYNFAANRVRHAIRAFDVDAARQPLLLPAADRITAIMNLPQLSSAQVRPHPGKPSVMNNHYFDRFLDGPNDPVEEFGLSLLRKAATSIYEHVPPETRIFINKSSRVPDSIFDLFLQQTNLSTLHAGPALRTRDNYSSFETSALAESRYGCSGRYYVGNDILSAREVVAAKPAGFVDISIVPMVVARS